jgi:hypothetical protein
MKTKRQPECMKILVLENVIKTRANKRRVTIKWQSDKHVELDEMCVMQFATAPVANAPENFNTRLSVSLSCYTVSSDY